MQRVLVTGNAGAGKTTLVRMLATKLDIPGHSLDSIVWQQGWKKTPSSEKRARIHELTQRERWVIDGVSFAAMATADTIIFLGLPRHITGWRAAKRTARNLLCTRPEMPAGCPEGLVIAKLARIIWTFPTTTRLRILDALTDRSPGQVAVHIASRAAQRELITALDKATDTMGVVRAVRSLADGRSASGDARARSQLVAGGP